jgi:hypothetical protein
MPQLQFLLRRNRRASVAGLVLVALLFLLPFCSVSCAGADLLSYRGQQLATGGDSSASLPQQLNGLGSTTTSAPRTPSPDDAFAPSFLQPTADQNQSHTDIQPLALTAALAVLVALVIAAVVMIERVRSMAVAILAAVGALALIALQPVMNHALSSSLADVQAFDRAHQTSGSSIDVPDLSGLIGLDWSIWYYFAIVGLLLIAGLNALVLRGLRPPAALPLTAPPPPAGDPGAGTTAALPPPPPQAPAPPPPQPSG